MNELRGALRVKEITAASGAGGDTYASIQPPEGEVWDVYAVMASHNDAGGLTVNWIGVDAVGSLLKVLYTATAQPRYLYQDLPSHVPIRMNHDCYIAFKGLTMAGAKTITLEVLYERIVGVVNMNGA